MSRLNNQAWNILKKEVELIIAKNVAKDVQREIVLKRLEALRSQEGNRLKELEIKDYIYVLRAYWNH